MNLYIGADLGTSSLKLLLVGDTGEIVNSVTKEYKILYPKKGWSEQRPEDWWNAFEEGISELLEGHNAKCVRGIGVAGQMHGLVALDKDDNVIRPAILWNDGRTCKENYYLNNVIGKDTVSEYTANISFAGFTAPKILWMKENEKENFCKIKKMMLPKDYINYRLTGVFATDYSDASGTLLLDVRNKRWSEDMIDICSVRKEQLPKLFDSFDVIGRVKPEFEKKFGLEDVSVIAGTGDNAGAAIGTGTVGEGRCNISLGTSGTIFVSSDSFSVDNNNALHSFCHADGGFHLMGCILSAASCNKWICDNIFKTKDYGAEEANVSENMLGNNTVFFLPYLMGERSPINDTDASGLFIGMRSDTRREDMYLAVLEGVAFAIRDNLEVAKKLGIDIKKSFLCGGGARSKLWCRILANVLNLELELPISEEGPGYGVAMLAMVSQKEYASIAECCERLVGVKQRIKPDEKLVSLYEEKYEKYKKIYPAVKMLYKEI